MRRSRNKSGKLPPFVPLTWELLNGRAYKELSGSAAKALPYFLGKVKVPFNAPERYKEEFSFSYTEARQYGFANATFSRIISGLVEKGFIDPTYRGGIRSCGLSSSRFRLSQRWRDYGTSLFKEVHWKEVRPELVSQAPRS